MPIDTKDWHAWLNTMPPGPEIIHVVGEVTVGNPGIEPSLTIREPQGINPAILMLNLHLVQKPGAWVQVITQAQAHFKRVMPPRAIRYKTVEIYYENEKIAVIEDIPIVT